MGRIVGAFGVQGWVKVKPFTQSPENLGRYGRWWIAAQAGWREAEVLGFDVHGKGPVARLEGVADRTAAEGLRGADIAVTRETLGEAEEGTLYWADLVGLEVVDERGAALGRVEGLFETGASAVMVVKGERERLIPFVPDYVLAVDRGAGRITVDWKPDYDA